MLKEAAFANAAALLGGVVYLVCRLLAGLAPDLLRALGQSWFHSYDFSTLPVVNLSLGLTFFGFLTAVGLSWASAYFFAWIYNRLAK